MDGQEQRQMGVMQGQLEAQQDRLDRMEDKLDVIYERVTSAKGGAKTLLILISVTAAVTTLFNNLGSLGKWLASN